MRSVYELGVANPSLMPRGWNEVVEHGVRTVVDLRNSDQRAERPTAPPDIVDDIHLPLEEDLLEDDAEFLTMARKGWLSTPLYYPYFVERWPDRLSRTVDAVADAAPGCVIIHCSAGRDRTGLVTIVWLSLVGVAPETIAADLLRDGGLTEDGLRRVRARLLNDPAPAARR